MKFHDPRNLSILNAFVIAASYVVLFIISVSLVFNHPFAYYYTYLVLGFSAALLFTISFSIFRFTLEKFIYSKVRLIYKSIHSVKVGKKIKTLSKSDNNLIDNVQEEVDNWESEKQGEIERLKQLEKYRRDFIGNVSHELKTPLFNIQGYVSTLLDGGLEDETINREYLKRTEKSVERLIRIIADLDKIAQLDSGEISLNLTNFDVVALAKEIVDLMEMKASRHNVEIVVNDPGKVIMVEGDKDKIKQVFTNIIDNSIRYCNAKKGRTKIGFFDMDENILIELTDNGIGIDQEDILRVFERFYRTESGRAVTRKGRGLGLAIVKHIMEAHNQTVNVRSTIGVGTTFGFTLKKA